jgi:putative membrane protein
MRHIIAVGTLLALSACNNPETQDTSTSADGNVSATATDQAITGSVADTQDNAAMNPTDPASFVKKAGAGDMFEIESSKAVLAKSNNADVKKFAQMMIDHHTRASEKLMAAAKEAKVSSEAPKMDAMQQSMVDDIKNADASGVDAVYLRHQETAHNAALALHQNFAANGTNDSLKKAADEMVGVVKSHINELQKMNASNGRSS